MGATGLAHYASARAARAPRATAGLRQASAKVRPGAGAWNCRTAGSPRRFSTGRATDGGGGVAPGATGDHLQPGRLVAPKLACRALALEHRVSAWARRQQARMR